LPGEYQINHVGGKPETAYRTDGPYDALERGLLTSATKKAKQSPLGPMGSGATGKAKMYRHNRKGAARAPQNPHVSERNHSNLGIYH